MINKGRQPVPTLFSKVIPTLQTPTNLPKATGASRLGMTSLGTESGQGNNENKHGLTACWARPLSRARKAAARDAALSRSSPSKLLKQCPPQSCRNIRLKTETQNPAPSSADRYMAVATVHHLGATAAVQLISHVVSATARSGRIS